jgi:hypothetical protein
MYRSIEKKLREAVEQLRGEAKHRQETTPSDVAAEAFATSARIVETALNEAMRDTETLTPTEYAQLHNVTPQSVTLWIRKGELEAERTPNGWLISRDAKRSEPMRKTG